MPTQVFTVQEMQVLKQAAQNLANNPVFAASRMNMTKSEQKTADAAMISAQLASIQNSIDTIDDRYTTLKAAELSQLNDSLSFYQGLLTKIQNTPE